MFNKLQDLVWDGGKNISQDDIPLRYKWIGPPHKDPSKSVPAIYQNYSSVKLDKQFLRPTDRYGPSFLDPSRPLPGVARPVKAAIVYFVFSGICTKMVIERYR